MDNPYVTVSLPPRFVGDYMDRGLPSPDEGGELEVVKATQRAMTVRLNKAAFDDLLSDARFYSDANQWPASVFQYLGMSARATVRRLENAEKETDR